MSSTWKYRACDDCLSNSSLLAVWLRLLCFCAIASCTSMCQTLPLISRGNLAAFQASHSPSATLMVHGHVSVAEARALFLMMVVSVGSGLYVGPGPSPLLRTYPESGSRELGGIRSLHGCWCTAIAGRGRCFDQVVGTTTKAKNNTRNMGKFPEKNVTMTHAEICAVKHKSVRWV